MEEIVKDQVLDVDELAGFLILQACSIVKKERQGTASQLTKYIALEHVDPAKLSTTVAYSDLVTDAQLLEAYKKQAVLLSVQQNYNKGLTLFRMSSSISTLMKFLSAATIRSMTLIL
jgi:hypothetical protein